MLIEAYRTLRLIIGLLAFSVVNLVAQKKPIDSLPTIQKINGVTYEVLSGLAEIRSIQKVKAAQESKLGYDEYQVKFRFIPMEGDDLLQILQDKELEFKLEHRSSSILVGPAFIKKMSLKTGTRYAMDLYQTRSGGLNVRRYFYQSKAIEHQLYKAYDNIIDSLGKKLSFNATDSSLMKVNSDVLTGAEQRALMDAELRQGLDSKNFAKPQFTKAAFHFLQEHKALLNEYEAAIRVLAQLEEKKYQEQLKKEAAEKKAAQELADKIKAMKSETIPSVVNQTKIVRGCYYEVVPGLAEVTAIKVVKLAKDSHLNYDEHQVLFHFTPMEGHALLEALKDTTLEFFLYHRGDKVHVGPAYIEAKGLNIGTRYEMTLYQKRNEQVCSEQYTYSSKALDNDLFEAFPPRTIFIEEKEDSIEGGKLESISINKGLDSSKIISEDSLFQIKTYEAARKDLKQAKNDKRIWRKKINETIRIARMNTRVAKKAERQERVKMRNKKKGIQLGKVNVSKERTTTTVNKRAAIQNARKKARMTRQKMKE